MNKKNLETSRLVLHNICMFVRVNTIDGLCARFYSQITQTFSSLTQELENSLNEMHCNSVEIFFGNRIEKHFECKRKVK